MSKVRYMKLLFAVALFVLMCNTAFGQESEGVLDVSIRPASPINPDKPEVILTYTYSGATTPLVFSLPKEPELPFFEGVDVMIDGNAAETVFPEPELISLYYSHVIKLKKGEKYEFRLDLSKVYKIPESWKKMEVRVKQTHRLMKRSKYLPSLVLDRDALEEEATPEPGKTEQLPKVEPGNKGSPEEKIPSVEETPKPIKKPKPVVEPVVEESEPGREWLVICLIVAGVVIAGLIFFLLLRRKK